MALPEGGGGAVDQLRKVPREVGFGSDCIAATATSHGVRSTASGPIRQAERRARHVPASGWRSASGYDKGPSTAGGSREHVLRVRGEVLEPVELHEADVPVQLAAEHLSYSSAMISIRVDDDDAT